jgi:hypothetical protein
MAIALTTATALALAGLLAVSVDGFLVASAIRSAAPAAGHLVTRHVGYSIPTVLLSLFSQSMVLFYFIGTGRLVKDEIASYPEADRRPILRELARFKAKTSPPATFSLLTAIAVFVLGGAVHTRALPPWTHLAASAAAIATHAWAITAEWKAFGENHRLMADPRAYVKKRAT